MNIIIVRNASTPPWRIDLTVRRGRGLLLGAAVGCVGALLALGAAIGIWSGASRAHELHAIAAMHTTLDTQRRELEALGSDSRRNLDALSLQLGQLQAQATRLNALGERLTQIGKLDDGEFDFSGEPAMGGPEEAVAGAAPLPLQDGIDGLRATFDAQQTQLDMLERLLRDQKIDKALLPTGMPVAQGYISSGFGGRSDPFDGHQARHLGVDFAAQAGAAVMAVADGVVTFAGERSGYGNVVEIDHGNGYVTRYAHNSVLDVTPGQRVRAGETIANVGSTGRSTGPHCHFEVWHNGRAVNPMAYVKNARSARI